MAEEEIEEIIKNPEESDTPEEETDKEAQDNSEKPEKTPSELEEANKKLYARMKKAEDEAKLAKEELVKSKKVSPTGTPIDVFDLAKTVSALKDYNLEELGDIQMIAKAKGVSPEEAVKTEEAQLIITARREKVAKNQAVPDPSGAISGGFKIKTQEELATMEPDAMKKYAMEFERHKKRETGA